MCSRCKRKNQGMRKVGDSDWLCTWCANKEITKRRIERKLAKVRARQKKLKELELGDYNKLPF